MAITGCVSFTKVPPGGKSCWKVNGTRFFLHLFCGKSPGAKGSKKIDSFFPDEMFETEIVFHFFKAIFV